MKIIERLGCVIFRLLNTLSHTCRQDKADGYVDLRVCFGVFFCHDTKEYTSACLCTCVCTVCTV